MSEPYQLTLRDYLDMARRRAGLIALTFVGVLVVGLGITMAMPPVYQSTATIVIESQQVPTDMVQATVTSYADERIEIIKQRVMTRENLLRIIEKYRLYESLGRGLNKTTPSEAIDEMRARIAVTLVTANVQNRNKGAGTIAFKLSYEDRKPDIAQKVTNDLVTLFLDENVKARTERASQTTEFLSQEATKLKTELETLEKQIADYKISNGNALPENITLNTNTIQRLEADLRSLDADSRAAQEELRSLELELAGAKAGLLSTNSAQTKSPELELTTARDELARLQATYTDNHPDVRAIKRKIAGLEKALAAGPQTGGGDGIRTAADLQVARIETRIKSTRERIAQIGRQQASVRGGIAAAEGQVLKAPQVERGLAALSRDYQNAQKKYDEIRAKQMTAQVAENMEGEQRAERFSLLEPPLFPEKPIRPNRSKNAVLSFVLALAAAAGLVAALETMKGTVRGEEAVAAIIGQHPLVSIPYIELPEEIERRKRMLRRAVIMGVVALLAVIAAVHFFLMPLDLLVYKLLNRLS